MFEARKAFIRGYKSISDIAFDLRDVTLLFGKNASGKTSITEALGWFFFDFPWSLPLEDAPDHVSVYFSGPSLMTDIDPVGRPGDSELRKWLSGFALSELFQFDSAIPKRIAIGLQENGSSFSFSFFADLPDQYRSTRYFGMTRATAGQMMRMSRATLAALVGGEPTDSPDFVAMPDDKEHDQYGFIIENTPEIEEQLNDFRIGFPEYTRFDLEWILERVRLRRAGHVMDSEVEGFYNRVLMLDVPLDLSIDVPATISAFIDRTVSAMEIDEDAARGVIRLLFDSLGILVTKATDGESGEMTEFSYCLDVAPLYHAWRSKKAKALAKRVLAEAFSLSTNLKIAKMFLAAKEMLDSDSKFYATGGLVQGSFHEELNPLVNPMRRGGTLLVQTYERQGGIEEAILEAMETRFKALQETVVDFSESVGETTQIVPQETVSANWHGFLKEFATKPEGNIGYMLDSIQTRANELMALFLGGSDRIRLIFGVDPKGTPTLEIQVFDIGATSSFPIDDSSSACRRWAEAAITMSLHEFRTKTVLIDHIGWGDLLLDGGIDYGGGDLDQDIIYSYNNGKLNEIEAAIVAWDHPLYARLVSNYKSVLLVDEPELHLHPGLQQRLAREFPKLPLASTIILATHSPSFLSMDLSSLSLVYVFRHGDETRVRRLDPGNDSRMRDALEEMGAIRGEVLQSYSYLLLVEGIQDKTFLSVMFRDEILRDRILIVPFHGTYNIDSLKAFIEMFQNILGIPIGVLMDHTRTETLNKLKGSSKRGSRKTPSNEELVLEELVLGLSNPKNVELHASPRIDIQMYIPNALIREIIPDYPGHDRIRTDRIKLKDSGYKLNTEQIKQCAQKMKKSDQPSAVQMLSPLRKVFADISSSAQSYDDLLG